MRGERCLDLYRISTKIWVYQRFWGYTNKKLNLPTIFPIYQQKWLKYRQFFNKRQNLPCACWIPHLRLVPNFRPYVPHLSPVPTSRTYDTRLHPQRHSSPFTQKSHTPHRAWPFLNNHFLNASQYPAPRSIPYFLIRYCRFWRLMPRDFAVWVILYSWCFKAFWI